MRVLVPQYHHNNCAELPMTPSWQFNEGKLFERRESTLWVLRSSDSDYSVLSVVRGVGRSQEPQGRFMPLKVLTFVQLPQVSHWKLCTIGVVVLRHPLSSMGVERASYLASSATITSEFLGSNEQSNLSIRSLRIDRATWQLFWMSVA